MQAKRVDSNQPKVVADLRKAGVVVFHTHEVGKGFPDIICAYPGDKQNYLFEIKDPEKPPSARKLTEKESLFHGTWPGQVNIIETAADALEIMGLKSPTRPQEGRYEG